jgi:hypothetical protein
LFDATRCSHLRRFLPAARRQPIVAEHHVETIRALLAKCSPEERAAVFLELRVVHRIHAYEDVVGAPAETILEAIHRAPELTRRMLRGVIADAAFAQFVIPKLQVSGWADRTPPGNHAYDYTLHDGQGSVTVQVKLQRSERGKPSVRKGERYGFPGSVFMTETQKTRSGTDGDDNKTRPYRYGEFDVLAVSMQPSAGEWGRFMYTVSDWLIAKRGGTEMATMQPVTQQPGEFWTDDFDMVAKWLRAMRGERRMVDKQADTKTEKPRKRRAKAVAKKAAAKKR